MYGESDYWDRLIDERLACQILGEHTVPTGIHYGADGIWMGWSDGTRTLLSDVAGALPVIHAPSRAPAEIRIEAGDDPTIKITRHARRPKGLHFSAREQSACLGKRRYRTREHAEANVDHFRHEHWVPLRAYRCRYCGNYHVGHQPARVGRSLEIAESERRKWGEAHG